MHVLRGTGVLVVLDNVTTFYSQIFPIDMIIQV